MQERKLEEIILIKWELYLFNLNFILLFFLSIPDDGISQCGTEKPLYDFICWYMDSRQCKDVKTEFLCMFVPLEYKNIQCVFFKYIKKAQSNVGVHPALNFFISFQF